MLLHFQNFGHVTFHDFAAKNKKHERKAKFDYIKFWEMLGVLKLLPKKSFINWRDMLYKYKNTLHHGSREKWAKSSCHRQIRSHRRPCSPAKTAISRPFPDRTIGSWQVGRDPAVSRPEWPGWKGSDRSPAKTAGIDGIWPFPELNGRHAEFPAVWWFPRKWVKQEKKGYFCLCIKKLF
jgi:hypothetical protein